MSLDAAALLRYMRGAMGDAVPPRTQALRRSDRRASSDAP
jgi:hypothetical protein